ncbi:MAG: DUF308 domain-containing protein [Acidobacteria bacterium]|nr:hypothetical protein [Solirubrobacteraceae bacterium]MBU6337121.1 DUF308 domain-containing protein [Acidobacteriota bacterium]
MQATDNTSGDQLDDIPPEGREALKQMSVYWWLWLIIGIAWIIIALVILQFTDQSLDIVGIIIGAMFIGAGIQYFVISTLVHRWRWVWIALGTLLIIGGVVAIFNPAETFEAVADVLGFIFLLVGITWIFQAFAEQDHNDLWWLGLIAGILMLIIAFWTAGQLAGVKQDLLIVFAGVWALMAGVTDVVRAFQIKSVGERLG